METQPRFSPLVILLSITTLIGVGIAIGILLSIPNPTAESTPVAVNTIPRASNTPPLLNRPAPDFTLQSLSGEAVRLSDYRGRVVFVNFWGTWCPPCVEELPEFEQFARVQGDQGAVVLAVNSSETAEQITTFLTENAITLDHVPVLLDSEYDVLRAFGVADLLPTTFVIAPNGTIAWIKFGAMTEELMQVYVDDVLAAQEG